MKKLLIVLSFSLLSFAVNANSLDTTKIVLHRVNWVDQIGTKEEISKEIKLRNELILEYRKDGYVFDKLERTSKGLFMKFIKK